MTELERYLNRATRGLWGARRQVAQQELHGAVEDKVWRLTLQGLGPDEAQAQALHDLGSPHTLARGLFRVHGLPPLTHAALLAGVVAALGLSGLPPAGAQVRPQPLVPELLRCDFNPAGLSALQRAVTPLPDGGPTLAQQYRLAFTQLGQTRLEALCRSGRQSAYLYLDLEQLTQRLTAQGVTVSAQVPSGQLPAAGVRAPGVKRWWTFPGSKQAMPAPLEYDAGGRRLVSIASLVTELVESAGLPVSVSGTHNPTLSVGRTTLQLGDARAPVDVTSLYSYALWNQLWQSLGQRPLYPGQDDPWTNLLFSRRPQVARPQRVALPDGALVTVLTWPVRDPLGQSAALMYTTRVRSGQVRVLSGPTLRRVSRVTRFVDLRRPTARPGELRVMLLRLTNTDSLSDLSYDVLP